MAEQDHARIPVPEYDDPKELWAFYGLTAYEAQLLEQSLINLAAVLQLPEPHALTREAFEEMFSALNRRTPGKLIHATKKLGPFPDGAEAQLMEALEKRNYLVHHFFRTHDEDLMSETGRRQMIDELRDLLALLQNADRVVEALYRPLWVRYGADENFMAAERAAMKERAERRDRVTP